MISDLASVSEGTLAHLAIDGTVSSARDPAVSGTYLGRVNWSDTMRGGSVNP